MGQVHSMSCFPHLCTYLHVTLYHRTFKDLNVAVCVEG